MNEECFRQGENITFCRRMQEANTLVKKGLLLGYTDQIDFCPYCGVNIRRPKQPTHEGDREEFLEAIIDTYGKIVQDANALNSKMMEELSNLRNLPRGPKE